MAALFSQLVSLQTNKGLYCKSWLHLVVHIHSNIVTQDQNKNELWLCIWQATMPQQRGFLTVRANATFNRPIIFSWWRIFWNTFIWLYLFKSVCLDISTCVTRVVTGYILTDIILNPVFCQTWSPSPASGAAGSCGPSEDEELQGLASSHPCRKSICNQRWGTYISLHRQPLG